MLSDSPGVGLGRFQSTNQQVFWITHELYVCDPPSVGLGHFQSTKPTRYFGQPAHYASIIVIICGSAYYVQ